jgi:hypothetical protein
MASCAVCVFRCKESRIVLTVQRRFRVEFVKQLPKKVSICKCYIFSARPVALCNKNPGKRLCTECRVSTVRAASSSCLKNYQDKPHNNSACLSETAQNSANLP